MININSIKESTRYIELEPQSILGYSDRALYYFTKGDFSNAIKDYTTYAATLYAILYTASFYQSIRV